MMCTVRLYVKPLSAILSSHGCSMDRTWIKTPSITPPDSSGPLGKRSRPSARRRAARLASTIHRFGSGFCGVFLAAFVVRTVLLTVSFVLTDAAVKLAKVYLWFALAMSGHTFCTCNAVVSACMGYTVIFERTARFRPVLMAINRALGLYQTITPSSYSVNERRVVRMCCTRCVAGELIALTARVTSNSLCFLVHRMVHLIST